jgi:hypothetical protein
MPTLARTHELDADLDWAPLPFMVLYRASGLAGAGAVAIASTWALLWLTGGAVVALVAGPLLGIGGASLSRIIAERAMLGVLRRRIEAVSLRELAGRADGGLVRVRGVVRLGPAGALTQEGGVFERLVVRAQVKERAVDFVLVDENGEEMLVEVADARLVHLFGNFGETPVRVSAGDSVEVVGRKHRAIDPGAQRLPRQDPVRASLTAPLPRPLLIVPQWIEPALPATTPPRRLTE